MRTRTLFTSAAFLAVSAVAGTASAQLQLKGSDTLELVTKDVIAACPGANGNITYIGGGSGTGQAAMVASPPTQHVAPMSRQMNNAASCTTNSRQLVIGLDGIAVVAVNSTGGDPNTCTDDIGGNGAAPTQLQLTGVPSQFVACSSDTVCATAGNPAVGACNVAGGYCSPGGTLLACTSAQGCSPDGTYTFDNNTPTNAADDWKDVLAQIYGGQNHTGAAATINDPTEVNADGTAICTGTRTCKRNPARIDCTNPVRGVLMSSYGSIIRSPLCTGTGCTKLRHAFRRDDLSGTTDAFQALVGLVAIAPFTTLRSTGTNNPEIADSAAVANPFCNAGTAALNKGFSDGLDLDPYRRSCAVGGLPDRFGLESVCQAFAGANNSDVSCYVAGGTPAVTSPVNYPQREKSSPQGRGVLAGGSVETFTALQTDYLSTAGKPRCLGVVLPISIPQDLQGATVWATNRYPAGGNCTPGIRAFVNPFPVHQMVCPDGAVKANSGTCRLPQNTANGRFDCIVDSTGSPGNTPDPRVYNLQPVDNGGHVTTLLDSYANPNFANPNPSLRRFARRYFGLHMVRPDNSQKAATATSCQLTDDTSQIGCLVKTSPCSLGFAGREASDPAPGPFANVALRIETVQGTQASIEALATGVGTVYPLARKLWFNSHNDPGDLVGFSEAVGTNLLASEIALAGCMGLPNVCATNADCTATGAICNTGTLRCTIANSTTIVDNAILAHNFIRVPDGVQRLVLSGGNTGNGCPLP